MVEAGLYHTKCPFYHVPEHRSCQVISQWMQACYAIKLLWVILYYTPVTSVFILKCNRYFTRQNTSNVILSRQTDSDSAGP
jgi:hypothetical protein